MRLLLLLSRTDFLSTHLPQSSFAPRRVFSKNPTLAALSQSFAAERRDKLASQNRRRFLSWSMAKEKRHQNQNMRAHENAQNPRDTWARDLLSPTRSNWTDRREEPC